MIDELIVNGVPMSSYPCTVRERRAGMTDDEFWVDVFLLPADGDDGPDRSFPIFESIDGEPCVECGEVGACSYDNEGRALIHTTDRDDS